MLPPAGPAIFLRRPGSSGTKMVPLKVLKDPEGDPWSCAKGRLPTSLLGRLGLCPRPCVCIRALKRPRLFASRE